MSPVASRPSPLRVTVPGPRWPLVLLGTLLLLAAVSGGVLGYYLRFDLPDVRSLEDYRPPVVTEVLAADGSHLDSFFEQRRILIGYNEIPTVFLDALLASEDADFYRHTGIDLTGIARAAWRDLRALRLAEGASTLTQQLARNLFLHPKKTFRRKIEEAALAMEIERQYTKQEILRFYCNQIYMGHGRYGIEAAARFYFGKPALELDLNEAATLAGLIQRPERLSPLRHPERALERRNYVLARMDATGALDAEVAAATQALPVPGRRRTADAALAPYFVEEVRRQLQQRFGSDSLYKDGLTVRTTLDPRLQAIANRALQQGLRELDRRQGWRGVARRLASGEDPSTWEGPGWDAPPVAGAVLEGVVVASGRGRVQVRTGGCSGELLADDVRWTGKEAPEKLLAPGDRIQVRIESVGEGAVCDLALDQEPLAEAAMLVLDPASGEVKALVGGFDFGRSEFDRAMQARRQTGSAFKPFVYAAALAAGLTLADTVIDEPTVFLDPTNPQPYQPENYTHEYHGRITLRTALEKSANIATVKLLDRIGYDAVIDTARRLGLASDFQPFPSLALGAFETSLIELTSAYGAFANLGVLVEPHLVREVVNRDGGSIARIEPEVRDAVSPQVAYLMNSLLAGVITDGTGQAARSLGLPLAGKTGTTDQNTDAWFVGYAPNLVVGVWVGFDEPRSLGRRETGAIAALPIWQAFMEDAFTALPVTQFVEPPGIVRVAIDRRTGARSNPRAYCTHEIHEAFLAGTEPTNDCSVWEHQRLRLPLAAQRFALDEQGTLVVPSNRLEDLLAEEPGLRLADGGRRLDFHLGRETVSLALRVAPPDEPSATGDPPPPEPIEATAWVGKNGRPARVVWIDGHSKLRAGR